MGNGNMGFFLEMPVNKMMRSYLPILILFTAVSACTFIKPHYVTMLSPAELSKLNQEKTIFIVDVHIPERRHIEGTDAFVPFHKIKANISKFPEDKDTPIYVYCLGGPMANHAARTLHKLGYKNLYNLSGGSSAWKKAGYGFK